MSAYLDPEVSRRKFDEELVSFRAMRGEYIKRGIWLLEASFPLVLVGFVKQLRPAAVVFGASLDFTDYDLRPPSVTLVDPFTRLPLKNSELMAQFPRLVPSSVPGQFPTMINLVQAHSDNRPFICLPGVREYHEHPAHTGDSWLLHRGSGEGTLHFLVEKLHLYGVTSVLGFNFTMSVGFQQNPIE